MLDSELVVSAFIKLITMAMKLMLVFLLLACLSARGFCLCSIPEVAEWDQGSTEDPTAKELAIGDIEQRIQDLKFEKPDGITDVKCLVDDDAVTIDFVCTTGKEPNLSYAIEFSYDINCELTMENGEKIEQNAMVRR